MVEQSDSFFTVPEDFDIVNHKRASPETTSNRPAKKRSVTPINPTDLEYGILPPIPRQNSTMSAMNHNNEPRDMAIREKENGHPNTNHKVSRSMSMAIGKSKETVEPRKLFSRRRMSEARHETWDAITTKTKKFCNQARPHLRSHRDSQPDTLGPDSRHGPVSQSWTRRPSGSMLDMSYVPTLPQRTSSLEQSSYAASSYMGSQMPGSCADHPAHQAIGLRGDEARFSRPATMYRTLQAPETMLPSASGLRGGGCVQDSKMDDPSGSAFSLNNLYRRRLPREDSDTESGIDMDDSRGTKSSYSQTVKGLRQDPASLPTEIVLQIFRHLDMAHMPNVLTVSKRWNELAFDPSVQKTLFMKRWRPQALEAPLPAPVGGKGIGKTRGMWVNTTTQDWNRMYQARVELERNWRRGNEHTSYLFSHTDSVYCVQFDEHKAITGSRDQTIRVWNLHTNKCTKVIGGPDAYAKDHRRAPAEIELTQEMQDQLNQPGAEYFPRQRVYFTPTYWHKASILCLQYDDEILVTGSSDTSLIVWDIDTFEPKMRLSRHTSGVLDLAFDNDKIVSCSKDFSICIWDRRSGDLLSQIRDHQGPVNAIQLRNDYIVSASGEGSSHLYELNYRRVPSLKSGAPDTVSCTPKKRKEFWSKERGLACIEYSDDGKHILAGGNDHVIFKYDTRRRERPQPIEQSMRGHDGLVRSLYLDNANKRLISGSYDLSIKVWDYISGRLTRSYSDKTTSWILSAKSDFRRIVATSQDGRVVVMDFGHGVDGVDLLTGSWKTPRDSLADARV